MDTLLTVRDLRIWFNVRTGLLAGLFGKDVKHVRAVDGISFDVKRGEVFCLVGESGCGKTTTGKGLIRLNAPTGGNIFFDAPQEEWNRFLTMERRLGELQPLLAKAPATDGKALEAAWTQIQTLTSQLAALRNPGGGAAVQARRQRIEKMVSFLEDRDRDLVKGVDPALVRILSKGNRRLELMESRGSWFTPRRARKLERAEKELKEARYQAQRATSLQSRVRRTARQVRRLERRIKRFRNHEEAGNPATERRVKELRRSLDEKAKRLTDLELTRVRQERKGLEARLQALEPGARPNPDAEIHRLESMLARIRTQGGAGLEALEVRAAMGAFWQRYDLAGEAAKGRVRMRNLRRRVQIIYQDPYESLNPKLSIYDIVAEPLIANKVTSTQAEAQAVVAKALEDVGLRPSSEYMFRYPHELSGGQRQRVGIATALVVDPDFIVADEPVSMLDASVRTEIIALLLDLKKRRNLTYLFITHDLGLAWIIADRVAVMYLGKIVEMGNGPEIIQNPRHPYTKALISVVPSPNPTIHREKMILRGERPNPVDIPSGCRFHPRCPVAVGICGWDAEEVRAALEDLFKEDGKTFEEAHAVTEIKATGPFSLAITTSDGSRLDSYLRKRIPAVARAHPALGAIRKMEPTSEMLVLTLHQPVEPQLLQITENVTVACHLVEPEMASTVAAQPEAVQLAK